MKKGLVTGAGGFIGSFLCPRLIKEGYQITALALPSENVERLEKLGCTIVRGDLTRPETLGGLKQDFDLVYHLAARVASWGTRQDFYSAIYDATRHLMDAVAGRVGQFIFISSVVAIGLGKEHLNGHRESDPTRKTGIFYGDAKLDAEGLVWQYHHAGRFTATVIRPTNVIGPGSVWIRESAANLRKPPVTLVDGGQWSASLLYMENLVDALVLAGTLEVARGQTYHIMDDYRVTWREFFTDVARMMGLEITPKLFRDIPFDTAWALAGVVGGLYARFGWKTSLTRHNVGMVGRHNDLDTRKAQSELGWKTRIPYPEARERIACWMKEAGLTV